MERHVARYHSARWREGGQTIPQVLLFLRNLSKKGKVALTNRNRISQISSYFLGRTWLNMDIGTSYVTYSMPPFLPWQPIALGDDTNLGVYGGYQLRWDGMEGRPMAT